MVVHTRLVLGLDLLIFRFLIRRQNLHHFRLDAGVFDLEIDRGLGVLCGKSPRLRLIERTSLGKSVQGGMVLMHLLQERLKCGFFLLPDGLDLILLCRTQIESVCVEAEHMTKAAIWAAAAALSEQDCGADQKCGDDREDLEPNRFHKISLGSGNQPG